jgi:hypothetical protein
MWLAALIGRLAYLTHLAAGHAVTWKTTWKTSSPDSSLCPGDIVCNDCGQVLWCRAHDPWRAAGTGLAPDHWGGTRARHPRWTLFESLQHILQLAEACPPGVAGDAIRRAACELVEADIGRQQSACRRRMLRSLARLQSRQSRGRCRTSDPSPVMLVRLADALRRELRPG